jgi:hypothetical protein
MKKVRFTMIGGFLGAGKTTTMARLARFYMDRGQKVGLVTNDQAADLVDTTSLRSQGFAVEEIAGACFCCRFNDLVDRVGTLEQSQRPDVILAEPVGSCTDLVATVVQPLKDLYGMRFEIAPYMVLFKPSHGLKILRGDRGSGFSPKAAYIFRKQLEEADAIAINRIDEMKPEVVAELTSLIEKEFPGVPVLKVSAKTGEGFGRVPELLGQQGSFGRKILDIDYDTYAEGEAEMGWLNSSVHVTSPKPLALDGLLLEVVAKLRERLGDAAEVAHLKAIGLSELSFGVANLVSSASAPELSLASAGQVREFDLVVNARVAADPKVLEEHVREVVTEVCQSFGAAGEIRTMQSFRPGRPMPTHRYAEAK